MSNYIVDGADLTSVANAIRTKGGTSGTLAFPNGFISAVEAIETGGGGGEWTTEGIAANSEPSGVLTIQASTVAKNAFCRKSAITSVSLPHATLLYDSAFEYCSGLTSITAPELLHINAYGFRGIGSASVIFPKATIFRGAGIFQDSMIVCAVLPSITEFGTYQFASCPALKAVDIGPNSPAGFSSNFINGDRALDTLILRKDGVVAITHANQVNNTPLVTTGGLMDVYVPSARIAEYQAATNWSTYYAAGHCEFHAIEGSIYETQYADGTPIPTA